MKTISRFPRNTVDLIETVRRMKGPGIEVIFHQKNVRTCEAGNDLLISALSTIVQAQNKHILKIIENSI